MAHDVFVSYSSRDKTTADAVVATVERAGIRCWVAPRDVTPGDKWADAIVRAIEGGRLMVLVFSSDSNASQHIIREVELAAQHRIPVVPFRVEDVQPCPTLDYYIAGTHWLDAIDPPMEEHLERLALVLGRLLDAPRAEDAAGSNTVGGAFAWTPPPPPLGTAVAVPAATGVLSPPVQLRPAPLPERPTPIEPEMQASPPARRRTWMMIGVAAAPVLVAGVVLAIWLTRLGGTDEDVASAASPSAGVVAPTAAPSVVAPSPSVDAPVARVSAPTDLRADQVTAYQVKLIWTRPREGGKVDHFRVYRDGEPIGGKLDVRWFVDEEVLAGGTYRYRVVAIGDDGSRASTKPLLVNVPVVPPSSGGSPPASSGDSPPACDGILTPSGECIPWS